MKCILSKEEIISLLGEHQLAPEKRVAQKALAEDIVRRVHGEKSLQQAIKVTQALFSGEFENLSLDEFHMLEKTLDAAHIDLDTPILDLIVILKLAQSKREARQFIQSGAITINSVKIESIEAILSKEMFNADRYLVVRRGKKNYAIAILKEEK